MYDLAVANPPVLSEEMSLVSRLLGWLPQASSSERAKAVSALARAYLYCGLSPEVRAQAEIAMTAVLDDTEPRVRRALAEALASAAEAPRHIVLALVNDHSDVSRVVLTHSPLLSEADLVDAVAIGDFVAQRAIARRPCLPASVSAALTEVGDVAAILALVGNTGAEISRASLWRLFERFHEDDRVRASLGDRPGLPAPFRAALAAATTDALARFAASAAWIDPRRAERISREGREQAFVAIAAKSAEADLSELIQWLRSGGQLTAGLLMRALAGGDTRFFRQAVAEMSGVSARRVEGLLRDPKGRGFAALYRKAAMPEHLLSAFRVAVDLARFAGRTGLGVDYALTMKILRTIEAQENPALTPTVAMLWRLASEGARDDARGAVAEALAPPGAREVETGPRRLEISAPPILMLNFEPGNENDEPPIAITTPDGAPLAAAA